MKKIKWTLMSLAIVISLCSAFVTRPKFDCSQAVQYRYAAGGYQLAGQYGIDFICDFNPPSTCTYFTINGIDFYPCAVGYYLPCCAVKEPVEQKKP